MKILLLVDDYLPNSTKVHGKMVHQLAEEFLKLGHQPKVIVPDSTIKEKYELNILNGVSVYRFRAAETRVESKIKRAVNETMLSFYAWKNLKEIFQANKFELIIAYSPTIFFGPLILNLKRRWNSVSYLILRDIFPQWAIDRGLIKRNSFVAKYFHFFEKINYKVADQIGLQSPKNKDWFNTYTLYSYKTEVLFNWSNEEPVENKNSKYFRNKYGLKDKIILFYGGNMGEAQDMLNLVNLAENLQVYENVHFVFAGSGNEFELVKRTIEEKEIKNILLLKPVSQFEYRLMLSEFDIGLFTLHKKHSTHNFPGKLLGYMVQGLPILGSVNSGNDVKEVIEKAGAGFISINGDLKNFIGDAEKLINDRNLRNEISKNSSALLNDKFSAKKAAENILNSYYTNEKNNSVRIK